MRVKKLSKVDPVEKTHTLRAKQKRKQVKSNSSKRCMSAGPIYEIKTRKPILLDEKKARAKGAAGYIKKNTHTQDGERNRVGGRRVRNVRRREKRIEAIKETIMIYISERRN